MAKVLVIDDIDFTRQTISKILSRKGFEVYEAANGKDGLRSFSQNEPDLVLTDILMPEMEGLETIKILKTINPDVPIIAITGSTNSPFLQIALKFGAATGLFKPFKQEDLLDTVNEHLRIVSE